MIDEISDGKIDFAGISKMLACPIIGVSAKTKEGIAKLEQKILEMYEMGLPAPKPHYETDDLSVSRAILANRIADINVKGIKPHALSEQIDDVLIHPLFGLPIFLGIMWALFMITFTLGAYPQNLIAKGFAWFGLGVETLLGQGVITSAISQGILPAVGAVIGFLPNILILFLGINLLEQTGYMARSAFMLDGTMKRFGLAGKSFIPLITGLGCSIPAYMSTKTLQNKADKILTMLVIGFFSCSARLPVYVLILGSFFAPTTAGNLLFIIYFGGALTALVVAKFFRLTIFRGESEPFALELPRYRLPNAKAIALDIYVKGRTFIKKAGTFIATAAFAVWLLSSFGANESANMSSAQKLENSYIGQFGHFSEPIFKPIGFSWEMTVATISALAAKEVAVSTLATLYAVGGQERGLLQAEIKSRVSFASAMAFIVIMALYSPCIAALSVFFQEVKDWKYRAIYLIFPNVLAWIMGFITYKIFI